MQERELPAVARTKSRRLSQAVDRRTGAGIFLHQRNSLARVSARPGNPARAYAHISWLNRAITSQPTRAQTLLQLQRQYGNRYVQRVMALNRQVHNEAKATPEVEETIQQARSSGQTFFKSDFGGFRVYTDAEADPLNRTLTARAFIADQKIPSRGQNGVHSSQLLSSTSPAHIVRRKEEVSASAEFIKEGWEDVNELGIVYQEKGANLRDKPVPQEEGSKVIANLPQSTKVYILKHDKKNKWFAVTAVGSQGGGKFGYIADWLIWRKLPEPDVKVYKIKQGDYPLKIAAREQDYFTVFDSWGEDLRYVVNALVYVNTSAQHNGTGEPGLRKPDNDVTAKWFETTATKDVYIWLPSSAFLKALYSEVVKKGGGTGSITADLWESAKGFLKKLAYGAAFIGGLVHGFVKSIVDAVVGIVEMIIDILTSIFTLNVINDAKEIWNAISELTWKDIKDAVGAWADKWGKKLESSNPFVAGHAHGYLTGYVMGEVAMLLVSGGTLAALKGARWATKFGKIIRSLKAVQKLEAGVHKVGGKAKGVLKKARTALKRRRLRDLTLDNKHVAKHLPGTRQSQRIIDKEGAAHVFNDETTMQRVAEAIKSRGDSTGLVRGHERWGLRFDEPIGYRIDRAGNRTPLHYGEMKITGDKYHVIPRTGPSK